MAKIKTDRVEAAQFNGRTADFVHDVTALDGPAFDKDIDQVIVRIDGEELYFFANEVLLTDDEKKTAAKYADKAKAELGERDKASKDNDAGKAKLHDATKRDAKPAVADVPKTPAPPAPMTPPVSSFPASPPAG